MTEIIFEEYIPKTMEEFKSELRIKREQTEEVKELIFELAENEKRIRFGTKKLSENEKKGLMFNATRHQSLLELNSTDIFLLVGNYGYERTNGDDTTTPAEVRKLMIRYLENEKRRRCGRCMKLTEDEMKAFFNIVKRDYRREQLKNIRIIAMNRMIAEFMYTMSNDASKIWGY